ncbi:hypothetical protein LSH36_246g03000, partial [Paralvinella palmiformis]
VEKELGKSCDIGYDLPPPPPPQRSRPGSAEKDNTDRTAIVPTPPSIRRQVPPVPSHPPPDPDTTLDQAVSILSASKKASRKKSAPIPPKRTSSFKDQQAQALVQGQMALHPGYFKDECEVVPPGGMENWQGGDPMVDSAFWYMNEEGVMETSASLTDQQKSQSSSEELLSTPGSQSRSGSLERILENRIMSGIAAGVAGIANRSRSSSRDRSLSGSSPHKSSDQKTPETDISESSLPPPPPALLEDSPVALIPIQPPPPLPISPTLPQDSLPLGHLRQSLRKTRNYQTVPRPPQEDVEGKSKENTTVTSLGSSNVKHVINRYGTIPKGARIGQFLASLENTQEEPIKDIPEELLEKRLTRDKLSDSCSNVAERVLKMPTPEVRRKVEEWQAGVDHSFAAEEPPFSLRKSGNTYADASLVSSLKNHMGNAKDSHHNVKPSALLRSSSIHEISSATTTDKPQLATFLGQQKSEQKKSSRPAVCHQPADTKGSTPGAAMTSEKPQSPVPEWKRLKPKPSPLAQPKLHVQSPSVEAPQDDSHAVSNPIKVQDSFKHKQEMFEQQGQDSGFVGSPPRTKGFSSRNASTSSDELLLDRHSQDSLDSLDQDQDSGVGHRISAKKPNVPPPRPPPSKQSEALQQTNPKSPDNNASGTESSMESSTDSLMDSVPKVKLRNVANEKSVKGKDKEKAGGLGFKFDLFKSNKDKIKGKEEEKKGKETQEPGKKGKDGQDTSGKKGIFGGLLKQSSQEKEESSDPKQTPKSLAKFAKDNSVVGTNVNAPKPILPGARPVLPGSKQVLPPSGGTPTAVISSPQQLASLKSLHHVSVDKDKMDEGTSPASKQTVITMCRALCKSLDELNSSRQKKHSSSFMHLAEEVKTFYTACSGYVESLPPHGKFHFRELLTTLQKISENLKTCSTSNVKEYDRLLGDLQNSVKEIDAKLSR